MEQIIQLNKPAIAGTKQKTELRQLPFFEKSLKTTQKAPTRQIAQTVSQKHLAEVKHIFDKVDEVFKKRKEDCILLVWQIADLQNELVQLESTTNSYAERAAGKGTALNWMLTEMKALQHELDDLQSNSVEPTNEDLTNVKALLLKGDTIVEAFNDEISLGSSQTTEVNESINESTQSLLTITNELLSFNDLNDCLKEMSRRFTAMIQIAETKLSDYANLETNTTHLLLEGAERNLMIKEELHQKQVEQYFKKEKIYHVSLFVSEEERRLDATVAEKISELECLQSEILNAELKQAELDKLAAEERKVLEKLLSEEADLKNSIASMKVKIESEVTSSNNLEVEIKTIEEQIEIVEIEVSQKTAIVDKLKQAICRQRQLNEDKMKAHEIHCKETRTKLDELHYFLSIDGKIRFELQKAKSQLQLHIATKIQENNRLQQEIAELEEECSLALIERENVDTKKQQATELVGFANESTLSLQREIEDRHHEKRSLEEKKRTNIQFLKDVEDTLEILSDSTKEIEQIDEKFSEAAKTNENLTKESEEHVLVLKQLQQPLPEMVFVDDLSKEEIESLEETVQKESEQFLNQIQQQFESEKTVMEQAIESIRKRMEKGIPDNPELVADIEALEQQIKEAKLKQADDDDDSTIALEAKTIQKENKGNSNKRSKPSMMHESVKKLHTESSKEKDFSMEDWFNDANDLF